MAQITIEALTFGYEGSAENVFEQLSLQFDTDWRIGLVGRNGRGKTTLLRLLQGGLAHRGRILSPMPFVRFPYEMEDPSLATGPLLEGLCPGAEGWQLQRELSLLGLAPDILGRPFSTLSGGERTRVLLSALFLREDHFPLIDEPTNHLDIEGRALLGDYLRGKPGFLLVSHDRAFLDRCTDHTLALNNTGPELVRGSYSRWAENARRRELQQRERDRQLRRDIARLGEAAGRTADWSDRVERSKAGAADKGYVGHKAAKMMKRAKATEARRDRAVEEKRALLQDVETAEPIRLNPLRHHERLLVEARALVISHGGRPVFAPLDLRVERGERVALRGANGSGKSSLLKLLAGEPLAHEGLLRSPANLVLSTLPQELQGLCGPLRDYAAQQGADLTLLLQFLKKLGLPRSQFDLDLSTFSEGQKKKVLLAASLCRPAHLYLWDEPLNYIDLLSRLQIEELILAHAPTLLFVEHDRAFCDRVATRTVALQPPAQPR
ncbi:MAG: ABC-F family ATP-binding cassette domain-containing protein [Clostridiales bacterium]|nr:ABC-F family ATP-binding cassette domain-containing protein [Clostridiales bacterium]